MLHLQCLSSHLCGHHESLHAQCGDSTGHAQQDRTTDLHRITTRFCSARGLSLCLRSLIPQTLRCCDTWRTSGKVDPRSGHASASSSSAIVGLSRPWGPLASTKTHRHSIACGREGVRPIGQTQIESVHRVGIPLPAAWPRPGPSVECCWQPAGPR